MSARLRSRMKMRRGLFFLVGGVLSIGCLQISACSVPQAPPPGPEAAAEYVERGIALQGIQDFDGAIAKYQQALTIDPNNALAHYHMGSVLSDKQDYDGAMAAYQQALRLKPGLAEAHFGLGYVLASKGDRTGAFEALKTYLREAPPQGQGDLKSKAEEGVRILGADLASDQVKEGVALERKGDTNGAVAAYQKALSFDPNHAVAHYHLGSIAYGRKDYNGAIAEYRKALSLQPDLALAHMGLGYALAGKGDKAGAIAELRAYLRDAPAGSEEMKARAREDLRKLQAY